MSNMAFIKKEKQLERIIGKSFLKNPYQIQHAMPLIKTRIITREISSAFFSLNVLISCGSIEIAVKMPATMPTTVINPVTIKKIFQNNYFKELILIKKKSGHNYSLT